MVTGFAAESVLSEARLKLPDTGITQDVATDNNLLAVFVKLDINMARLVLNKQGSSKKTFNDVYSVAHCFVAELRAAMPSADVGVYESLWPMPTKDRVQPEEQTSGPSVELYEVDASGKVVHPLALVTEGHGCRKLCGLGPR